MITIRVVMAALMLGAAPTATNAQELPVVGSIPGDWSEYGRALMALQRHQICMTESFRA